MEKFNRDNLALIRKQIENAISEVAKKNDIHLVLGSMRFAENEFTVQLKANTKNQSYLVYNEGQSAEDAMNTAPKVGDKFIVQRDSYTIERFEMGRPKFPVIAVRDTDGKKFKFPISAVTKNKQHDNQ